VNKMACTTTALSGKKGSVTGAAVAGATEIKEWHLNMTQDALDATSFASAGVRQFVPGLVSATGSLVAVGAYFQNTSLSGAAAINLITATVGGTAHTYAGAVIFTSSKVDVTTDGLVTFAADFTVCGGITVT
jgi:hypothetical protein